MRILGMSYSDHIIYRDSTIGTAYPTGEVDFWIFLTFNFLQFAIDWKNNTKTKVE
jgi:hypothetical protein